MKRPALAFGISLLLTCLLPASALAASVVDQSNEASTGGIGSGHLMAQTFKVGLAGRLTGFDLRLSSPQAANVSVAIEAQVRATGMPTGTVLSTTFSAVSGPFQWIHFQLPTTVDVLVGSRLAIVVDMNSPCQISHSADTYAGGTEAVMGAAGWEASPEDLSFRTYVDTAVVTPAPTEAPAAPTPAPTAVPTLAPTVVASVAASVAPSATPTPAPSATPAASVAASVSATASVAAQPLDPKSGGSTDALVPILAVAVVVLGLALGGAGFMLGRRRPPSASPPSGTSPPSGN
jgi:hypothetical protein